MAPAFPDSSRTDPRNSGTEAAGPGHDWPSRPRGRSGESSGKPAPRQDNRSHTSKLKFYIIILENSLIIKGFVIDGVIRDIAETRENKFPVFARGVIPKPGAKKCISPLNQPIKCAGVTVHAGDIIVADEEGIAVIPKADALTAFDTAKKRAEKDGAMTLAQWQAEHVKKVESILTEL